MTGAGEPAGRALPRLRGSLGPMPTGPWTWLGPLLVTALGGFLRFFRLGRPREVVFDETYYVKDAWSLLQHGHERAYVPDADARMLAGSTDILTDRPTFIVHPPVGKWVIAAGEQIGGLDPVGWRLGVAVLGTASVFLLARIGIRLTRSILLGCLAGLLLALDGLAVVMSRTALLDGTLAFLILAAFGCLLVDRDHVRDRAARASTRPTTSTAPRWGLRPWRIAAGVFLGLALGTKWSALPFIAAFGLMSVAWDAAARRAAGDPRPWTSMLRRDAGPAFASLVVLAGVVYTATWTGWLATRGGWSRDWAEGRGGAFAWLPDPLRSLWHYHAEMRVFHTNLTDTHPYESSPWGWPVLARPVAYYSDDYSRGEAGCQASRCVREVLAIGTPALWWAALGALVFICWRWAGARDWRAGALLGALAAGWLPWLPYAERPTFFFYAVVLLPFLVLALTMALGALIGPALPDLPTRAQRRRRLLGSWAAGLVVLAVVVNFFYLYPILTAETLSRDDWRDRMWLPSWI